MPSAGLEAVLTKGLTQGIRRTSRWLDLKFQVTSVAIRSRLFGRRANRVVASERLSITTVSFTSEASLAASPSGRDMAYALERLAPGSYDVLLDGEVVASLTRSSQASVRNARWLAELLTDAPAVERPEPFHDVAHEFESFVEACDWLGVPRPTGSELLGRIGTTKVGSTLEQKRDHPQSLGRDAR